MPARTLTPAGRKDDLAADVSAATAVAAAMALPILSCTVTFCNSLYQS